MSFQISFAQTNTVASGNWNTGSNWSTGNVPGNGTTTNVNHPMTLDRNLSPTATYTINVPVTDPDGGANYNLDVSGNLDVRANMKLGGALQVDGNVIVRIGDTLIIGFPGSTANSNVNWGGTITIEAGGVLVVNGNLETQFLGTITCDGEIIIDGNFHSNFLSGVGGSGSISATGTITTGFGGSIFGDGGDCNSGPCSAGSGCGVSTVNSITLGFLVPACIGVAPGQINGNNNGGPYQWQRSTTSASTGFANIGGATDMNYSPGALAVTTWFRRVVAPGGGCPIQTSTPVQVTLTSPLPPSVSISSTATSFCSGASVTFTATPVNGGVSPLYQWKRNGVNVGTNSANYTSTTLSNGHSVSVVMTSNATCVTASPATSNSIAVTVISGGGSWSGISSSNWNTNSNWCTGARPTNITDVTINGGTFNDPLISTSNAICDNLDLNSTAALTVNGRNLRVYGDLTVNSGATLLINSNSVRVDGNIRVNAGGIIIVNSPGVLSASRNIINNGAVSGTGTLLLNGTIIQNITGSGTTASNFTLDNAAGCNVNSTLTLSGILTLTTGQLRANNNLTIDLNTGAIAGTGVGTISGDITLQKSVNSNKYHYISSPLSWLSANEWNDDVQINFMQYKNLFTYNEDYTDTSKVVGWDPVPDLNTSLVPMKGYALYFNSPATMDVTGIYTHDESFLNAALTNTISGNSGSDGWNLVGNPYPSTLDWDALSGWTKTNLDGAIYLWDPVNNRYASYVDGAGTNGGVPYIPSMQAFWVKVNAAGGTGTLGMNNSVRTTAANPAIWRVASTENILKLTASGKGYSDETIIRFLPDANETFDSRADAYKKSSSGNTPSLYTESKGVKYSINSLPNSLVENRIPVVLKAGFTGLYTISAGEIATFGSEYSIIFEDSLLGVSQDLRSNPHYTCNVGAGDTALRFYLHFRKSVVNSTLSGKVASISIRGSKQTVYVTFENIYSGKASIMISDVSGKEKFFIDNVDINNGEYAVTLPSGESGIYVIRVVSPEGYKSEKVFLHQ